MGLGPDPIPTITARTATSEGKLIPTDLAAATPALFASASEEAVIAIRLLFNLLVGDIPGDSFNMSDAIAIQSFGATSFPFTRILFCDAKSAAKFVDRYMAPAISEQIAFLSQSGFEKYSSACFRFFEILIILPQIASDKTNLFCSSVFLKNEPLLIELIVDFLHAAAFGITIFDLVKIFAWPAQGPLSPNNSKAIFSSRASVDLGNTFSTAPQICLASELLTIENTGVF